MDRYLCAHKQKKICEVNMEFIIINLISSFSLIFFCKNKHLIRTYVYVL